MKKSLLFSRLFAFLFVIVLGLGSAYFVLGLEVEQDNASMQSDKATNDQTYQVFRDTFDAEFELILSVSRENLATSVGQQQLQQESEWVKALPGIVSVTFVQPPASVEDASSTTALLIQLDPYQDRSERVELIHILRTEADEHIEGEVYLVGMPLLKERVAHYISRDQTIVIPLSVITMVLILLFIFKRLGGVLFPMTIAGLSLLTTLGVYAAVGLPLNSITSLLPPVVIVLAVSVGVHLFDAWTRFADQGLSASEATQSAIKLVWKPCVFTAAMTAVGMLSLWVSPIPAVRQFGVFAALGVMLSIVFAFILFPTTGPWLCAKKPRPIARFMGQFIGWASTMPIRYPRWIFVSAVLLTALSLGLASRIENSTDLIRFFKAKDEVRIAHETVGEKLGSVRSINLLVEHADHHTFDLMMDYSALHELTDAMTNLPHVVRVESMLDHLNPADMATQPESSPIGLKRYLSDEQDIMRVILHLGDIGSAQAAETCTAIDQLRTQFAAWEIKPTGNYYQVVQNSNSLVSTLVKSFSITLIIVLVSTCLLFRDIWFLLPAFIPNMLPVIWGAGLMGALHIDLSSGTAMVAAVVIGLAIDDTIHYLHHFRSFKHLPVEEATQKTTRLIGRALTASSIVLACGFFMGAFGSFIPTNTFALLTACMIISALFCDLLVLPAYLCLVTKNQAKDEI